MKFLSSAIALSLLAAGCAFTPTSGGQDAKFQPPIVYQQWESKHYTSRNGISVCALTSGYNGLTVTVGKMPGGPDVVVSSTRPMEPSATLTVSANGTNFESYDTYFPKETGRKLAEALTHGGKAYLEWSEFTGPSGRERVHTQNILQLDDFAAKFNACRNSV